MVEMERKKIERILTRTSYIHYSRVVSNTSIEKRQHFINIIHVCTVHA